jgi:hypothetical protein
MKYEDNLVRWVSFAQFARKRPSSKFGFSFSVGFLRNFYIIVLV